ncbi:MAG TPA: fumarylacetoacetate hydrolase family protein [Ktedonobacteraceae bacterium]|nr:fumarylacetoacetate hydrolase family protein [Ktedonobacteraceae bacterium]
MYLVSYRVRGSDAPWRAGVERNHSVVDISRYPAFREKVTGEVPHLSMRTLLAQGQQVLTDVLAWASQQLDAGQDVLSLESLELGPPVSDPDKFLCLGVNYREHAAETNLEVPSVPTIFAKFRNCLIGPTAPILLPHVSTQIDYEGELAVIIGTRCKDVSENDALKYVAGYTVCNDVSARDIQMRTSQWTAGKVLDTFAPMGPGIVPASEIADPQTLMLTTRLNGQVVQHDTTADMVFSVATTIAFLSSLMTLEPGDIIATGTPSGVGFRRNPPLFMRHGDVVEVEIERVGTIRNPVLNVREGQ